ncbi:MAG TPA: hypothetical protein VFE58_06145 [Tepidisphaeraceae bacterium]|nr:hypothetical protein [Tepidisphaeraceae bacterium]
MVLASLTQISAAPVITHDPSADSAACYTHLTAALTDDSPWVRAHAAEFLITLGRPELARAAFEPISETKEPKYRVVVWRILAAATSVASRRKIYTDRIRQVLFDPSGVEQPHAMEALAKLAEPFATDAEHQQVREVADADGPASPFAVWRLSQSGDSTAVDRLIKLLRSSDAIIRSRAAYVLSRLQPLPATANDAISTAIKVEPIDSPAYSLMQVALGPDSARKLVQDNHIPPAGRYFAALSLAEFGTYHDHDLLLPLMRDSDHDVQIAASFALLRLAGPTATLPTAGHL